jgi:hypothetical protein
MASETLSAVARLLAHPEVTGVQLLKERPVCVGLRRNAKWSWVFGETAAAALALAEKQLEPIPQVSLEDS